MLKVNYVKLKFKTLKNSRRLKILKIKYEIQNAKILKNKEGIPLSQPYG